MSQQHIKSPHGAPQSSLGWGKRLVSYLKHHELTGVGNENVIIWHSKCAERQTDCHRGKLYSKISPDLEIRKTEFKCGICCFSLVWSCLRNSGSHSVLIFSKWRSPTDTYFIEVNEIICIKGPKKCNSFTNVSYC